MWHKKVKTKAKTFRGVKIETRVIDNDSLETVTAVKAGGAYGHSIEIGSFKAMWPLTLKIGSALKDTRQLAFRQAGTTTHDEPSWEWEATLFPNRLGGEEKRLLICASPKKRDHDDIVIRIDGDGGGEDLILKVPIE
jgi:hypothetical protein